MLCVRDPANQGIRVITMETQSSCTYVVRKRSCKSRDPCYNIGDPTKELYVGGTYEVCKRS
jgi:hypothetical protein